MRRAIADLKAFGKMFVRSKIGTFFTFVFPILLIVLFGAIFSESESQEITLHVQDADDSDMSHMLIEIMNNTSVVNLEFIPADEDIDEYIVENSLTLALRIPEGFEVNVTYALMNPSANASVNVTIYGDPSKATYGIATSVVSSSLSYMNYGLSGTRPILGMDVESVAPEEFSYIDFFIPGVVGITIMTTPMFAMASICSEYRNRGFFKLLATTPLRKSEWLVSKILWYMFVLYLSFALMLIVGILLFGLKVTLTLIALVVVAVGVLLFTSLGMLIGTITKNPETSAAIANVIMFPMMFLSGTFFPLEGMPSYLQSIATVLPLTYVNEGLRDTMIYGNSGSALTNLAVVVVIAVIMFIAASKLMSWKKK
ncbi:MAG: ABC transporter permease [Thermoplasmata archaeon]|nr:ABC transporter permease [Thermoplasmata archaeon]